MARFYHGGSNRRNCTVRLGKTLMPLPEILYGTLWLNRASFLRKSNMSSSLEDRVRWLTDQAVAAKTQSELDAILPELQEAIKDYIRYVRAVSLEAIPEAFGARGTGAT